MNIFTTIACIVSIFIGWYLVCNSTSESAEPYILLSVMIPYAIILLIYFFLSLVLWGIGKDKKYFLKGVLMTCIFIVLFIYLPELLLFLWL